MKPLSGETGKRAGLAALIGANVVGFQEESAAFDDLAARVLALDRRDLPCMTLLLFGGAQSIDQLTAALAARRGTVSAVVDRLEAAGYARRRRSGSVTAVELTGHARQWIERIWAPLRQEGDRLMAMFSTRELAAMARFMTRARAIHERQARQLRTWLELPGSPARKPHHRGGLTPAALRRVEVFVESNLDRPLQLADLAGRAGLSRYHFARAFRMSTGVTPRAFVEQCRIERATRLIGQSRQALAAIAVASGFGTQSRLTTTFKRRTGFTPAEYRRRHPARAATPE